MGSLAGKHKAPNSSRARCSFLEKFKSEPSFEKGIQMSLADRKGGEGIPRTATDMCKTTEAGQHLGHDSEEFVMNEDKGVADETGGRYRSDCERARMPCSTASTDDKECQRA